MNVTWKIVALGGTAILAITAIEIAALFNGINGTIMKISFAGIGAIVAGISGYTIGIKRK